MTELNKIELMQRNIVQSQRINAPGFVWDEIERKLDKRNKRRGLWIWFGVMLLPLLSFFIMKNMFNENNYINNHNNSNINSTAVSSELNNTNNSENTDKQLIVGNIQKAESEKLSNNSLNHANNNKLPKALIEQDNYRIENGNIKAEQSTELSIEYKPESEVSEIRNEVFINRLDCKMLKTFSKSNSVKSSPSVDKIKCPDFRNRKSSKFFVEGGLSIGYPLKKFNENTTATELLKLREETENPWYSWGAYGQVGLYVYKELYVGAGLSFTQAKERFILEKESITKMVINFDPVTQEPIDTNFVTGTLVNKGEIRYNSLDIPLFVGISKNFDKFILGAELSLLVNVNFGAHGKIFNEYLNLSRIEDNTGIYKNNIGLAAKASVYLGYYLNSSTSIRLKPNFRYQFKPINTTSYPIETRLNNVSLELGIRKDF